MIIKVGETALIMAAAQGNTSVVTMLLDAKADVNLGTTVRYSSVAPTKLYYFNVNVIRLPRH